MIRIQQIRLNVTEDEKSIRNKAAKKLHILPEDIEKLSIVKKSIDARKKPELFFSYVVDIVCKNEDKIMKRNHDANIILTEDKKYQFVKIGKNIMRERPVIIGLGPAGLFCGYMLAKHGYAPIIFERGKTVEERTKDVAEFWDKGRLLLHSNVQFGEGGAGTFSDGKLNTLVKDKYGRNKEVLRIFVENGAPEEILYENKPHIGTDILLTVIKNMRNQMLSWGAEIHYESQVTDFIIENQTLMAIQINNKDIIPTENVILAIGHSARDTFETLYQKSVPMEAKSFAVGFRVLHPQSMIDENQYGAGYEKYHLPPASYKLTAKTKSGRGVYSFCMCPGGYVVNASSEENRLAVNGMSYHKRDSGVANSAIIVSVTPEDYPANHPLGGMLFQRKLEEKAYELGNGCMPIQYYKDFKDKEEHSVKIKNAFEPCIKGKYIFCNLRDILTDEMNEAFQEGMEQFGRVIPGFADDFVVLAGVESRTSSPIRIMRDTSFQSQIKGLYPCGEGAGYAGGITSAAMDGICIAEAIASNYKIR